MRRLGALAITAVLCGCSSDADGPAAPANTAAPSPAAPSTPPPGDNGQTGAPGATECTEDEDCGIDSSPWEQPPSRAELVASKCDYDYGRQRELPHCQCTFLVTPDPSSGMAPFEYVSDPVHDFNGCSAFSVVPTDCVHCADEFPGCNIDDAASCDAACQETAERSKAELERTHDFRVRSNRCTEEQHCEVVVELDGKCYAGQPTPGVSTPFDCALSDAEILAQSKDAPPYRPCPDPTPVECTSAEDCPVGLGCSDGVCSACSEACANSGETPEAAICEGDLTCAGGEWCVQGVCVLSDNVECRHDNHCSEHEYCAVSGVDATTERGNEATRSLCVSDGSCPEPERDAGGNAMMPAGQCR